MEFPLDLVEVDTALTGDECVGLTPLGSAVAVRLDGVVSVLDVVPA